MFIYLLQWNKDRPQLALAANNKKLLKLEPNNMQDALEDTKSSGGFWIPPLNWIDTIGFSEQAKRESRLYMIYVMYQAQLIKIKYVIKHIEMIAVLYIIYSHIVQFCDIINDAKRFIHYVHMQSTKVLELANKIVTSISSIGPRIH